MKERWTWMSAPLIGRFSFRGGGGGGLSLALPFRRFKRNASLLPQKVLSVCSWSVPGYRTKVSMIEKIIDKTGRPMH